MAHGCCPECGGASCALRPVCPGEPEASAHPVTYGLQCRDCAPIGCEGGCGLPPFMD